MIIRRTRSVQICLMLLVVPAALRAQAVCSAPHSSPTLGQGGSIGTLPPGSGSVQLSAYSQEVDDAFDALGTRQRFLGGGETITRSLYVTAALGVVRGADVWAQAAVHHLRYVEDRGERERNGLGDIRLAARASAELLGSSAPVSLRAGIKIPMSTFPVEALVPLSEGQMDLELSVESGHSWAGGAWYILGWIGHRWRRELSALPLDPGDEWFGHVTVGGQRGPVRWDMAAEVLSGAAPRQQGIELPRNRRRLVQLAPNLALALGPGEVDLGLQVPLTGRNLPSDPGIGVGYRVSW